MVLLDHMRPAAASLQRTRHLSEFPPAHQPAGGKR